MELGAGNGALAERLKSMDLLPPLLFDHDGALLRAALVRLHGGKGERFDAPRKLAAVTAQAEHLPLADASLSGAVVADLLRQIPRSRRTSVAQELFRSLRPGGCVILLEDAPAARNEAEKNYRRALALLAQAQPWRAEATMEPTEGRSLFSPFFGAPSDEGSQDNRLEVADPSAPLRWLREWSRQQRRGEALLAERWSRFQEELDQLEKDVETHGMRYGQYWYQIFQRNTRGSTA